MSPFLSKGDETGPGRLYRDPHPGDAEEAGRGGCCIRRRHQRPQQQWVSDAAAAAVACCCCCCWHHHSQKRSDFFATHASMRTDAASEIRRSLSLSGFQSKFHLQIQVVCWICSNIPCTCTSGYLVQVKACSVVYGHITSDQCVEASRRLYSRFVLSLAVPATP